MSISRNWQITIAGFLICAGALLFSLRGLNVPFVLDDGTKIQWNVDLRKSSPRWADFFAPYREGETAYRNDPSRPLTYFIYWLCYREGGGTALPFHVASVVVHLVNALLLSALAFTLTASLMAAFAVGALFFFAPLLTDSVLYAFALSDLLAAMFVLAALLAHWRARWWLTTLFFVLALASKQSAIVVPGVLLLFDFLRGRPRWKTFGFLSGIALVYLAARFAFLGGIGDLEAREGTQNAWPYFTAQGLMIWKYLVMLVDYHAFTIDHFLRAGDIEWWTGILGWLGLALVSVLLFVYRRPLFWFWAAFLLCLAPTSSVLPTVDLFTERRAYLPVAFLFLAFARACRSIRRPKVVALLLLLSLEVVASERRQVAFASTRSMWTESLALYPENPRARLNLAAALSAEGEYEKAALLYEGLLPQQPGNALIYSRLGFVYAQANNPKRDLAKSWSYYARAIELDPDDPIALMNAASLLISLNRLPEAEKLVGHLLQISPQMPYAHYVAGLVYAHENRVAEAKAEFEEALRLDPSFKEARDALGAAAK